MSDRMLVATRKGLLTLARQNGGWRIAATDFPGVAVTATLRDARDGALYAVLRHGHFGSKLHRSDDDGKSSTELPAPAFPADAAGEPSLFQSGRWRRAAPTSRDGCGPAPFPRGLFRSDDRGASWQLVRALWDGRSAPNGSAAATTCRHPFDLRRSARPAPRVSSACRAAASGARDDGASWTLLGEGMSRAYMPPEQAGRRRAGPASASCAARPRPTCCGCSITTACSARPRGRDWKQVEPAVGVRLRGGGASARSATAWFVPAIKDERRIRATARWR